MTLRIVTDSTADLQQEWVEDYHIHVIPLAVRLEDKEILDGDIPLQDLYAYLKSDAPLPQTSQVSPGTFSETYKKLADEGATEIISIHISSDLSGTVNSARLAAQDAPIPVHVIDSRQATMGLSLIVRTISQKIMDGMPVEDAVLLAQEMAKKTKIYFLLNDLSTLEKGGRIGKAAYLLGSVLSV